MNEGKMSMKRILNRKVGEGEQEWEMDVGSK